ncbi:4-carboxymuconolactone decarboxylase [Gemella sp. ND 6198]|uniref:arsenosugar biosynthesis-associated peroxidase-like protein n=1 Tax=Gemella sp. ND 6198 TaxID=2040624 RepID=UPI000E0A7078|nr:arsenosugar biosynthesis-associated peroxidase-like protein [Gemella sp. ND 6198]AXI27365.1 4-carboxymuconolactone decarboxylase [Gemella sp. ND 6198]
MTDYFKKKHLIEFGEGKFGEDAPELWKNFMTYYGTTMQDGELTSREKALIAIAIAHSEGCPYCIEAYTNTCLEEGCDQDQIAEAIHVAAAMKAGITLVHGLQSKELSDKLTNR